MPGLPDCLWPEAVLPLNVPACRAWFVYRDKRNITSHTYDPAKAAEVAAVLPDFARHARELLQRLAQLGAADA